MNFRISKFKNSKSSYNMTYYFFNLLSHHICRIIIFIFFFISHFITLNAQFVEVGGFVGVLSFNGDVNVGGVLTNSDAAFGAFLRCTPNSRLSVKLGFLKGNLVANDRNSLEPKIRERNFNLKSDLMEFSLSTEFNILSFNPRIESQVFTPYIGLGISIIKFNPKTNYNNEWIELQPLGTEGQGLNGYPEPYKLIQATIPVLCGIKYSIGEQINIGLEFGYRFTFTDYLDDVSTIYISPNLLSQNGDLSVALSNRTEEYTGFPADELVGNRRGNSNNFDAYIAWGFNLSFNLFTKKKQLEFESTPYIINKWF